MIRLIRHLLAIAALPFTVTVLVPLWIASRYDIGFDGVGSIGDAALRLGGVLLLGLGIAFFAASLRRFVNEGEGTLAPWDPPRRLVVHGPYRRVRHPMISGVVFVLFGEALTLLSVPHGIWALTFLLLNLVYLPLIEEPQLARRFGEPYREYRRHVPAILPRWRPWSAAESQPTEPDG